MQNVGFRVIKNFKRIEKDILNKVKKIPVSIIGDASNRTASISSEIKSINNKKILGTAYTVRTQAGDNLLFYYAIDQAKEGDVIVVDGSGYKERALCGDIMAKYAQARKLAGFIIYGGIRDKKELEEIDFPIYACATTPNGPYKNGPGEINIPVNIGGRVVKPGDIIYGDETGIVIINPEDIETVLKKSEEIVINENKMLEDIKTKKRLDLTWMYKKLEENNCEFIEEV